MRAHVWTLAPFARDVVRPPLAPAARPWRATVTDPDVGDVELSGALSEARGPDAVVLVHGLGGSATSGYVIRFARIAAARGITTLRLNLRGADLGARDFYHAGLTDDLAAALASPALDGHARVAVVGFSLGGHVALRLAATAPGRIAAVAALCSPLDLAAGCRHLERRRSTLYRLHILGRLKAMYGAVAARRPVPVPPAALRRVTSLREWDARVVAPRFGFADVDDYHRRASVAPLLAGLAVPSLYLGVDGDPMVARSTVTAALAGASPALRVAWLTRGGHVGFPGEAAIYDAVLDGVLPATGGAAGNAGALASPWSRPHGG